MNEELRKTLEWLPIPDGKTGETVYLGELLAKSYRMDALADYVDGLIGLAEQRGYQRGLGEAKHYLTMPGETITANGKKYRKEQYVTLKESLKKGLDK